MIANTNEYAELFGNIDDTVASAAKCACVACNSCTCACRTGCYEDGEFEW